MLLLRGCECRWRKHEAGFVFLGDPTGVRLEIGAPQTLGQTAVNSKYFKENLLVGLQARHHFSHRALKTNNMFSGTIVGDQCYLGCLGLPAGELPKLPGTRVASAPAPDVGLLLLDQVDHFLTCARHESQRALHNSKIKTRHKTKNSQSNGVVVSGDPGPLNNYIALPKRVWQMKLLVRVYFGVISHPGKEQNSGTSWYIQPKGCVCGLKHFSRVLFAEQHVVPSSKRHF